MDQAGLGELAKSSLLLFPLSLMIFFAVVSADGFGKARNLSGEPITSNAGSRMMYAVKFAVIGSVNAAVLTLLPLLDFLLFEGETPEPFYAAWPALITVTTVATALITLERTRDAGKSRWFALLGMVPVVNFIFFFLRPEEAPRRPPYVPADRRARFAIGSGALLALAVMIVASYKAEDLIFESFAENSFLSLIEKQRAELPLPVGFDTVHEDIGLDTVRKQAVYTLRVNTPGIDPGAFQSRLTRSLKPQLIRENCDNVIVTELGWIFIHSYRDSAGRLLGEVSVAGYDCPRAFD